MTPQLPLRHDARGTWTQRSWMRIDASYVPAVDLLQRENAARSQEAGVGFANCAAGEERSGMEDPRLPPCRSRVKLDQRFLAARADHPTRVCVPLPWILDLEGCSAGWDSQAAAISEANPADRPLRALIRNQERHPRPSCGGAKRQ